MKLETHVVYTKDAEATVKALRGAVNEALGYAVRMWHRRILPKHFTPAGAAKYRHGKRTRKYMILKAKRKGHQSPMVWSGDMKRTLVRRLSVSTLKSKTRATGRMQRPKVMNFRKYLPGGSSHDFEKEVLRTAPDEATAMAQIVHRRSARKVDRTKKRRTKKIS